MWLSHLLEPENAKGRYFFKNAVTKLAIPTLNEKANKLLMEGFSGSDWGLGGGGYCKFYDSFDDGTEHIA